MYIWTDTLFQDIFFLLGLKLSDFVAAFLKICACCNVFVSLA